MKRFFKWTAIALSTVAGAAVAYRLINDARARLERGLERVEHITEDAQQAMSRTEAALGQTARTVRDVRQTIS